MKNKEIYMQLALKEANKYRYNTNLNPLVGCCIVKNNKIISVAAHENYGGYHAEINALKKIKNIKDIQDAEIFITLEPCGHYGKQAPCCHFIAQFNFKKIYIGQIDPNPLVNGKGILYLKEKGFNIELGILKEKCIELNKHYNFFYQNNKPFITLKQAMSLDGKISLLQKKTNITYNDTFQEVQKERAEHKSILIGANTVLIDNPSLTVRNLKLNYHPYCLILDFNAQTIKNINKLKVFLSPQMKVIIFTKKNFLKKNISKIPSHISIIPLFTLDNKKNMTNLLKYLYKLKIYSIYVEGGSKTHDFFLSQMCFNEILIYLSPKIFGGNALPGFYNPNRKISKTINLKITKIIKIKNNFKLIIKK